MRAMRPGFGTPTPALLEREREKGFVSHAGHIARIRRHAPADADKSVRECPLDAAGCKQLSKRRGTAAERYAHAP